MAEKVQAITFITRHQAPGTPGSPGSHHPFDPHLRPSFHLPFTHPLLPGLPLLILLVPPGPSTTAWLPPPPVGRLRPGTAPRRHPAPPRPHHGEYLPPHPHLRQPRPGGWLVGLTPLQAVGVTEEMVGPEGVMDRVVAPGAAAARGGEVGTQPFIK